MLIKYGGGSAGIRQYLDEGKKRGRELGGRDFMDERVVLSGCLEVTDKIIESMTTRGQRYLHITLSFSEKDLPQHTLEAIVADYTSLLMSAYRRDEYDIYAEAHLARVKGYVDVTTGEHISRLDHIHLVIPQLNLLTGRSLNPIGHAKKNIKWLDAIQESINTKYVLVSPKDRARDNPSTADIFQRSKLDNFKKGKIHTFKEALKEQILARNINSLASLEALVRASGDVKRVNTGKPDVYLAVKPFGEARYINLRDLEFRANYLSLSEAEKIGRHFITIMPKVGIGKSSPDEHTALIAEWIKIRAREVKYLNSGSQQYKHYYLQSSENQDKTLTALEERFYQKPALTEKHNGNNQGNANQTPDSDRFLLRQCDVEKIRSIPASRTIHSVRSVHQRSMDCNRQSADVKKLLQSPVSDELHRRRTSGNHPLQRNETAIPRNGSGSKVTSATGRSSDTVISQMLRDQNEKLSQKAVARLPDFQSLKARLDPTRLLVTLTKSHGVVLTDYEITVAKDGGGRLRHKDSQQNLNVSDFMTRHMKLSWKDAEVYLRIVYQEQMNFLSPPRTVVAKKNDELWEEFTLQRRENVLNYARSQDLQRTSERARRQSIRELFYQDKAYIQQRTSMSAKERRVEIALLQMQKVQKEARLRDAIQRERTTMKDARSVHEQYRCWLRENAQRGNEVALLELRQQCHLPGVTNWVTDSLISGAEETVDRGYLYQPAELQYTVDDKGNVTYAWQGLALIQDTGATVRMLDASKSSIELGLRLAMQKFGNKLTVSGTIDFIEEAIRVAVDCGMGITFSDPAHRAYMEQYQQHLAKQRTIKDKVQPSERIVNRAHSPNYLPGVNSQVELVDVPADVYTSIDTTVKTPWLFPRPSR